MDVEGFLISNCVDGDVFVTIPPSSLGPFDQPDVREHIGGYWVDMFRLPNRTWSDGTGAVRAVFTYLRRLSAISAGFPAQTR